MSVNCECFRDRPYSLTRLEPQSLTRLHCFVVCEKNGFVAPRSTSTMNTRCLQTIRCGGLPNMILTCHISGSSASPHFLERIYDIFAQNCHSFVHGEALLNELSESQLQGG